MSKSNYERNIKPKKSLGQHFLKNDDIAFQIAELVPDDGLPVLEIGPGTGALTSLLFQRFSDRLFLSEIDSRSIGLLRKKFPSLKNNIIPISFLDIDLPKLFPNGVHIVGNFPYNISSQIIFKTLENQNIIPSLSGMFQKEVAQRITATPGSKQYGQMTVLRDVYYDADYVFSVGKEHFDPPPKVESGVIYMNRKLNPNTELPMLFKRLVKQAFSQRRKKMRNSLKQFFSEDQLEQEIFDLRPEQLELNQFIELAKQSSVKS